MKKAPTSNCMISHPILFPQQEVVTFNGFAWSNLYGMIHQSTDVQQSDSAQWLGTQE